MLLAIDTATNLAGIALLDTPRANHPSSSSNPDAAGANQATAGPCGPLGQSSERRRSVVVVSAARSGEAGQTPDPTRLSLSPAAEPNVRGAYQWQTGRNHTVELMPNVM